jgi:FMN phosphatase YigB (HAD superfamily)
MLRTTEQPPGEISDKHLGPVEGVPVTEHIRFVLFDVDDVLIEMERSIDLAERAVVAPLAEKIGRERAELAYRGLSTGYATLRAQLRAPPGVWLPEYREIRRRIEGWQRGLVEDGHEVKQWSRDTLLTIALEELGVVPDRSLVAKAMDAYWETAAIEGVMFEDAKQILRALAARGVHYHLATNSDGFLWLDESARTFRYDPEDAAERKRKRTRSLTEFGVRRDQMTVGDPIGKPSALFYERALSEMSAACGEPVDRAALLAVGDSLTNDVLPLIALGAAKGALLDRHNGPNEPVPHPSEPRISVIKTLADVARIVWEESR